MRRFENRVGLVTGASGGVGEAIALALAAEGAAVGVVGRDVAALKSTVAAVESTGGRALALPADVRSDTEVRDAVTRLVGTYGGLDLVAHAAGALRMGPVPDLAPDDWDLLFDTNVKSCYLLARHAVPAMVERGGGAIVNIASVFAEAAVPGAAAYAASKSAVVALSRTMALDHIGDGIRINSVSPGSMRTPMLVASAAQQNPADPEAMLSALGRRHPVGRLVEPSEIAELVLYLLSDAAAAVVGASFVVDGGRSAQLGAAT